MVKCVEITTVNGKTLTADTSSLDAKNIDTLTYYFYEANLKYLICEDGSRVQTKHIVTIKDISDAQKEG
jgi:hypothetical protein